MYDITGLTVAYSVGFIMFGCILLYAQDEFRQLYLLKEKWPIRLCGALLMILGILFLGDIVLGPSRSERAAIIRNAFDIPPDEVQSVIIIVQKSKPWGNTSYEETALTNACQIADFCAALADRREVMLDHPQTDWECDVQINATGVTNIFRIHVLSTGGALINLETKGWRNYGNYLSVKMHDLLNNVVLGITDSTESKKLREKGR